MQSHEFDEFAEALVILATALDVEITPKRIEIYWRVLDCYPWSQVEHCLGEAMRRKWFKFPQPGELVELMEGTPSERADEAERAWQQFWRALNAGTYRSLYCQDAVLAETIRRVFGSWPDAGMVPRPESDHGPMYQVRHKEFLAMYRLLARSARTFDPYLKGRIEADNSAEALATFDQGLVVTYLPRDGTPEAVELRALQPDHPIVAVSDQLQQPALPEGERDGLS